MSICVHLRFIPLSWIRRAVGSDEASLCALRFPKSPFFQASRMRCKLNRTRRKITPVANGTFRKSSFVRWMIRQLIHPTQAPK